MWNNIFKIAACNVNSHFIFGFLVCTFFFFFLKRYIFKDVNLVLVDKLEKEKNKQIHALEKSLKLEQDRINACHIEIERLKKQLSDMALEISELKYKIKKQEEHQ